MAAYLAEQRTKEIGIRKVVGARVTSLVLLLCREFILSLPCAMNSALPPSPWPYEELKPTFGCGIDKPIRIESSGREDPMHEKNIAVREIYIALEIIKRRCGEFDDLKEFPGKDVDNLMIAFSEKYLDNPV